MIETGDSSYLPHEVIEKREKTLALLGELIELEEDLEVPDGGSYDCEDDYITIETKKDPAEEEWILDL